MSGLSFSETIDCDSSGRYSVGGRPSCARYSSSDSTCSRSASTCTGRYGFLGWIAAPRPLIDPNMPETPFAANYLQLGRPHSIHINSINVLRSLRDGNVILERTDYIAESPHSLPPF